MLKTKLKEQVKTKAATTLTSLTSMGPVELNVRNFSLMKEFYHKVLLLDILAETSHSITLGKNGKPLIMLHHDGSLLHPSRNEAGLYHFAIVHESRGDLARNVEHILRTTPQLFTGSGDHLVSEAFYFSDPEGNGIELYFDRTRKSWQWEKGQIKMATLYIDPIAYIREHKETYKPNADIRMGHVHLKVGDTTLAKQFYVTIMGFEVTAELPGALFVSVSGYHHHLGLNSWESAGAEKRTPSLGLKQFTIPLSDSNDVQRLKGRLQKHTVAFEETETTFTFSDPWNNKITIENKV